MYKTWRPKGLFHFEIAINILVSSFRFISIPTLWVYGHYTFLIISVRRPSVDVKIGRLCLKTFPTLKGLMITTIPANTKHSFCITYVQIRPNVFHVSPTLYKWYTIVLCWLGCFEPIDLRLQGRNIFHAYIYVCLSICRLL